MSMVVLPATGTSCRRKPVAVKTRVAFSATPDNVYLPFSSVLVPEVPPFTCTDTPAKGLLSAADLTSPDTVLVWATALTQTKNKIHSNAPYDLLRCRKF